MGMSYECALDLVSALNADFQVQLVETMARGVRGGGAKLTLLGEQVFAAYREVERQTDTATAERLGWLRGMLHVKTTATRITRSRLPSLHLPTKSVAPVR